MILAEPRSIAPSQHAPLSHAEFCALRDLLYDRGGLHFADAQKPLLEIRVHHRMTALGIVDSADYIAHLKSTAHGPAELPELLDVATVHETSFFRSPPQLDAFRKIVLRRYLTRREALGSRTLQIWSAACSSGEEPYTLAMLISEELGGSAASWQIRILGTDIARSPLERAQAGIYHQNRFRSMPGYYLEKYFEAVGPGAYRVKDSLRKMVAFRALNFADGAGMRTMRDYQVIFCRNALIYFDRETRRRFVDHFGDALEAGGYLFVGVSESLHGITDSLKLIHFPGALAYQKPEADAERKASPWNRTA